MACTKITCSLSIVTRRSMSERAEGGGEFIFRFCNTVQPKGGPK